jgi:hypothetical protein
MSETAEADVLTSGKLDKDQLDSIRLETQNISPSEREQQKRLISKAHRRILGSNFGQFISQAKSDSEIEERFLFMDKETRTQYLPEWTKDPKVNQLPSIDRFAAVTDQHGRFVAGGWDFWDQLPESVRLEGKLMFKNQFAIEDENIVASIINNMANDNSYVHEITHLYQNTTIPRAFAECGAYFYEKELREQSPYGINIATTEEERFAPFYQSLLEKYGDDVHKLFFGSLEEELIAKRIDDIKSEIQKPFGELDPIKDKPNRREQILSEFTPEVLNELFPSTDANSTA